MIKTIAIAVRFPIATKNLSIHPARAACRFPQDFDVDFRKIFDCQSCHKVAFSVNRLPIYITCRQQIKSLEVDCIAYKKITTM